MSFSESDDDDLDFDAIDALETQALHKSKKNMVILITGRHIRWALDSPTIQDIVTHDIIDVFDPVWTLVWTSDGVVFKIPKDVNVTKIIVRHEDGSFLDV